MMTGKAKLAGVIGWPIEQSRSPILHGYWLNKYGIDGCYSPLPVAPGDLSTVVAGLKALGFAGWNITAPHKEEMATLVDALSPDAKAIGAVNTVIRQADDSYLGHNTDAFGFIENLKAGHAGFTARDKTIVLLGAGGASRAVVHALIEDDAQTIFIANRSKDKAQRLVDDFGTCCQAITLAQASEAVSQADLLINGTSLGMLGKAPLPLNYEALPNQALVTDLVYAPLETDLLAWARKRGNPTVDGLGMLLHQARAGFTAWFGQDVQVDEPLRQAVLAP